jgi:hypothetical protein
VENIVGGFRLNQVPPLKNFLTLFFYWMGQIQKKEKRSGAQLARVRMATSGSLFASVHSNNQERGTKLCRKFSEGTKVPSLVSEKYLDV